MAVIGLLVVADGVLATLWQEPVTALLTARRQHDLREEWERIRAAPAGATAAGGRAAPVASAAPAPSRSSPVIVAAGTPAATIATAATASRAAPRPRLGHAAAELRIPSLDLTRIVVRGTTGPALRRGPGLYDDLSWPGQGRVSAIAGHRTTWGAPFRHLDRLRAGDRVELRLPGLLLRYRVTGMRIVEPHDRSVLAPGARQALVLTACDPPGSAAHRLAVRAELVDIRRVAVAGDPP